MSGVGEGGFSGITPCLRRMSFLKMTSLALADLFKSIRASSYHSVSALGSSTGTFIGISMFGSGFMTEKIHEDTFDAKLE